MNPQLKPCPFCGGVAEMDTQQPYRPLASTGSSSRLATQCAIYCTTCNCYMAICYDDWPWEAGDVTEHIVDQWNQRVPEKQPVANTWQPMSTAPLHERILMLSKHGAIEGMYDGEQGFGYYWQDMTWWPEGWMPLPPPMVEEGNE